MDMPIPLVFAPGLYGVEMRPRTISSPAITDPALTPFQKLEEFARRIVAVPKAEADRVQAKWEADKKRKKLIGS
jgi:hypothetical protein